ncbi:MAG TPA: hypothetical protein VKT28_16060 [Puia sp.]|nr:hypothetical protein [Puia sp.]
MKKTRTILRVLIFISFFSPFTTCKNKVISEGESSIDATSISQQVKDSVSKPSGETKSEVYDKRTLGDKIIAKAIFPTDDTISGIGSILFEPRVLLQISIGICFFISFFLVFPWKFLKNTRARLILLEASIICTLVFATGVISTEGYALEWGIYFFSGLTLIELILEVRNTNQMPST